jgi:hypothetical protein
MGKKPSALVGNLKYAMQLMRTAILSNLTFDAQSAKFIEMVS